MALSLEGDFHGLATNTDPCRARVCGVRAVADAATAPSAHLAAPDGRLEAKMKDRIWVCKDGHYMLVSQMATTHIRNAIAMIERSKKGWRRDFLPRLYLELDICKLRGES